MKKFLFYINRFLPEQVIYLLRPIYKKLFDHSEKRLRLLYGQILAEDFLVFDVGAHLGDHTDIFRQLAKKVVAVEPNPQVASRLADRFRNDTKVIIVKKGVGNRPGELPFFICHNRPTVSTFSAKHKETGFKKELWRKSITVPITTLDELIKEFGRPDYIKIDVENFEYQVLSGLSAPLPLMSIEFNSAAKTDTLDCLHLISKLGDYRFNFVATDSPEFKQEDWLEINKFIEIINKIDFQENGDIFMRLNPQTHP